MPEHGPELALQAGQAPSMQRMTEVFEHDRKRSKIVLRGLCVHTVLCMEVALKLKWQAQPTNNM